MDNPPSSMRDLARRLLASSRSASDTRVHEAVLVSDRLRASLIKFAGPDGFASLLRRALVLASAEVPALRAVKVGADGRLEGLEQLAAGAGSAGPEGNAEDVAVAITTHLLELLVTFVGESSTLSLIRDAGRDTPLNSGHSRTEADR